MASPEKLKLTLLGPLQAHPVNAPLLRLRTRKATALLLYLLVESIGRPGRKFQRSQLAALLWEGMPAASALENLRQTLYQIKKGMPGPEWLCADRRTAAVSPQAPVETDVARFLKQLATNPAEALSLYRGDLAADFSLPDSPAFEEWLEGQRQSLRNRLLNTLENLAARRLQEKDFEAAACYARQYQNLDPLNEEICQLQMKALAGAGKRSAALRIYSEYEALLEAALAARPEVSIRRLAEKIRRTGRAAILGRDAGAKDKRLLVLPFDDLNRGGEQDYFTEGIFDDLLTRLARVDRLAVISRTTATRCKKAGKSLPQMHEELGVRYVLEGSVRRTDERVKVAAKLIALPEDRHMWAGAFERKLEEVLTLQDEIAQEIARQLELRLFEWRETPRHVSKRAYDLLLKGQAAYFRGNSEGLERAACYFKEALVQAPGFAKAQLKLAVTYSTMVSWWGNRRVHEVEALYTEAIERSKADASLSAERHTTEGWMNMWRWDLRTAEYHFRRAVAQKSIAEWLPAGLAHLLNVTGRAAEALRIAEKGLETNPLLVQNHIVAAESLLLMRDYTAALEKTQLGLSLAPNYQPGMTVLAWLYNLRSEPVKAIALFDGWSTEDMAYFVLGRLGQAYATAGQTVGAKAVIEQLRRRHEKGFKGCSYYIALVYQSLGEEKAAMKWLETGYSLRDTDYLWMKVEPEWEPLRSRPRFQRLLYGVDERWGELR